jgi:hypothetical protein
MEYRVGFETISPMSIEDLGQAFYAQFDGVLAERCGRIGVWVYVEASSALHAAMSVIPRLEEIGFSVVRVDQDLVDGPEIANRLNVSRQAVQHWAVGTRGSSFPVPVGFVGGKRLWTWGQIAEWARREGKTDEPLGLDQDSAAEVDAMLGRRRLKVGRHAARMDWSLMPGTAKAHFGMAGMDDYVGNQLRSHG